MNLRTEKQVIFYTRHLPHYTPPGATLFLTFRLAGSLPSSVIEQLNTEYERVCVELEKIDKPNERKTMAYLALRKHFARWDRSLDEASFGPTWLSLPAVAQSLQDAIHYRDGKVYKLQAYCIMPNHVHVLFTPLRKADNSYHALSTIMQSLKGYSAYEANRLVNRRGKFWQDESYDHAVRDTEEYQRIIAYILNNPVKAGLIERPEDWPWSYSILA